MRKKVTLVSTIALIIGFLSFCGYMFILFMGNYVMDEKKLVLNTASTLVDLDGNVITKLYIENRQYVNIDNIPKHVQDAFIAVEDKRFYEHKGIDVRAIGRALYKDVLAVGKIEGGSTITQQLAKNVFLTQDKTLLRKTKEAIIAINLERKYTKEKILEMYLNQVYFGHGAYGIQAAALFYFNKDVKDLSIHEAALLAGIPKAPSTYSPILHPDKSKERRNIVLDLMESEGMISAKQAVLNKGKTLGLNIHDKMEMPWLATYIDMVLDEAKEKYHLTNEVILKGGYQITVPINLHIQQKAYESFQEDQFFPGTDNQVEGAFVLLDNDTGGVLAAIGGRNYVRKGINRIIMKRQPGSTLKPLAVYAPAMEEGLFEPYSLLKDEAIEYGEYKPKNYDDQYDGVVTMFDALIHSKNAPAVWVLDKLGIHKSKSYLQKNGILIEDKGLAIALGGLTYGVSPIDLANAYRTFSQNGQYSEPYFIEKIIDQDGNIVAKQKKQREQIFSPQTAWNMIRMLEQVVEQGTGKSGEYNGALAGKTGTTSYAGKEGAAKDAWFAGVTPEVTGTVWMGYDQTDERHYLKAGSSYATKLFKTILKDSHFETKTVFSPPSGIEDLDSPIRLEEVDSLQAKYEFQPLKLFTIQLSWNAQDDSRVVYRIYKKKENGQKELIATVKGKGEYELTYINIFSKHAFQVVPYNPQTRMEGKGTRFVIPTW